MKIYEVTGTAKVTRTSSQEVEIDHGDGTVTTVDTTKNPNAIQRDAQGRLKIDTKPKNSAMAKKQQQAERPKPGEKIELEQ